ncbi:dihydrofolate reductase [Arthrobacter sulfonylureivorans]|uniref:dihydrofolate reductase n=2 Tax=Arthrobacter sulfonylureivorans TaxID=2486855 RepID=A0ABY3W8R4_9MICC|nr:dihydrofolate reductase [Arthrobacter sulfonylureivorans]UNK46705.1 dihydrofolate reductase [Arthrobacter sulfonylureivorans]
MSADYNAGPAAAASPAAAADAAPAVSAAGRAADGPRPYPGSVAEAVTAAAAATDDRQQLPAPVVGMIWAQTTNGVIGRDGGMPWHLPEDLAHFKRTTLNHPVIMGRKTWESFPDKYRPLPGRTNIVISRRPEMRDQLVAEGAVVVDSVEDAMSEAAASPGGDEIWVLGGGEIFNLTTQHSNAASVTVIDMETDGDTYAPQLGPGWKLDGVSPTEGWSTAANGTRYRISLWVRGEDSRVQ